jgi:hypothetical protein
MEDEEHGGVMKGFQDEPQFGDPNSSLGKDLRHLLTIFLLSLRSFAYHFHMFAEWSTSSLLKGLIFSQDKLVPVSIALQTKFTPFVNCLLCQQRVIRIWQEPSYPQQTQLSF